MVMQYFGDGDLRNSLPNLVEDEWHNKLFVLSYVAFGLDAIHQQKLVHGDFHDGNILKHNSNKNAAAFISDLGLNQLLESFHHSSKENNVYGILPFVASEVLRGKPYTSASDIYGFSMIM